MLVLYQVLILLVSVYGEHRVVKSASYQPHMRPLSAEDEDKPLDVVAAINLRNIVDVNEIKQQITLETSLKLYWHDKNIKIKEGVKKYDGYDSDQKNLPYILLHPNFTDKIWIPDIFIDQSIDLRRPTYHTRPASIRVYNNSLIRFSSRFNFDVACSMDFKKYPVDDQLCNVKFESFSYTTNELNMTWNPDKKYHNNPKETNLAQFDYHVHRKSYSTKQYTQDFAGLILLIHFPRFVDSHLCQTYLPSVMFVTLGYFVFFIPRQAVPGRIGLGMMTFLTLTTMNVNVKSGLPHVSYMTYMDIWVMACMLIVFSYNVSSILEMAMFQAGKEELSKKLNQIFKFVFPLLFLLFNIVYWPIILVQYLKDPLSVVHEGD